MSFVRGAWKLLVAIKDGLVLLVLLLFFGLIYAGLSSRPNPAQISDGALVLKLDGVVVEQPAEPDPFAALSSSEPAIREYARRDLVRAIDAARADPRVKAVVLDLDGFIGGGQVALGDVGEALLRARKSGKPVLAYATAYANDGYLLAAHASEIWVDPLGGAVFAGPGGSNLYFKSALDRLGITAHVYRVGTYKSAVEPLLRDDQSPEAAEAATAVYEETWGVWTDTIRRVRPKAQIAPLITSPAARVESARGDLAALNRRDGVIDRVGDRIAFAERVAKLAGDGLEPGAGKFAEIRYDAYLAANPWPSDGEPIGVITIAGDIVDGEAGPGTAGGETVSQLIYDGIADETLKALVVRVDSPGGSVLASEQIRRAIAAAKAKGLPIVVSMGDTAASGGYWVSTPADAIFAEPGTVTGSIGIFGVLPSFEGALGKLGIGADGVRTTPLAGEPDLAGGFSPEFDRVMQAVIEKGYRDFITLVGTARGKTPVEVDAIAQGRVWAGGTARQLGLVDRFGGLDAALAEAARRAKLTTWHVRWLDTEPDLTAQFLAQWLAPPEEAATLDLLARARLRQRLSLMRAVNGLSDLTARGGAQARCLECISPLAQRRSSAEQRALWAVLLGR